MGGMLNCGCCDGTARHDTLLQVLERFVSPLLLAWAVLGLVLAASLLLYTLLSLGQAWYRHKLSTSGVRIQGDSAGSPGPLLTSASKSSIRSKSEGS